MRIIIFFGVVSFLVSVLTSCTFNNEYDYFGDTEVPEVCDTLVTTYDSLTYIFTDICSECHNSEYTYRGGIEMDTYISVKSSIETGKVLPAIKHEGDYKMPFELPKLSDCEIQRIELWIEEGMPE